MGLVHDNEEFNQRLQLTKRAGEIKHVTFILPTEQTEYRRMQMSGQPWTNDIFFWFIKLKVNTTSVEKINVFLQVLMQLLGTVLDLLKIQIKIE